MRLLIDTHILLWWLTNDPRLCAPAVALLRNKETLVFLSTASIWELRIKQSIGKVVLPGTFAADLALEDFEVLSIHPSHAHAVERLPLHHRDPFDRMLIAQATVENLTVMTHDALFTKYEVKCELV